VTACVILGGMTYSNGNSFSRGEGTERECPLIRRLLGAAEQRP